jgi:hypothetical protein
MNEYEVFSKVEFFHIASQKQIEKFLAKRIKARTSQDACDVLTRNLQYLRTHAESVGLIILGVEILGAIVSLPTTV